MWRKPNCLPLAPTKEKVTLMTVAATVTATTMLRRVVTRTKTWVATLLTLTLMSMLRKDGRVHPPPLNPLPRAPLLRYRTFSRSHHHRRQQAQPVDRSVCPSLPNHQRAAAPRSPILPPNQRAHTPKSSRFCVRRSAYSHA